MQDSRLEDASQYTRTQRVHLGGVDDLPLARMVHLPLETRRVSEGLQRVSLAYPSGSHPSSLRAFGSGEDSLCDVARGVGTRVPRNRQRHLRPQLGVR